MITHRAKLPAGFTATFIWTAKATMEVQWEPETPGSFQTRRAWNRFYKAYQNERRRFVEIVAHAIGGNVAVIDLPAKRYKGAVEVVRPPSQH